jgi:hypothetical protein
MYERPDFLTFVLAADLFGVYRGYALRRACSEDQPYRKHLSQFC